MLWLQNQKSLMLQVIKLLILVFFPAYSMLNFVTKSFEPKKAPKTILRLLTTSFLLT
jgi:Rad3-related DNA helicase